MGNETLTMDLLAVLYKVCASGRGKKELEFLKGQLNITQGSILITHQLNITRNSTSSSLWNSNSDHGAVMYIVAVLVFYSLGIVIMIIKYSQTEKKQMDEETAMDHYFKGMPSGKSINEHRVNDMAIKAFHTLTTSSYWNNRYHHHHHHHHSTNHDTNGKIKLLETDV
ncbi:hypothetical protein KP79_PYT08240 [Mizuhopecten yessoensis]|uniref:Uncharacterized protein n=1 Tax=Mizuhopecten yessoensis TaxID=6573 RepID=A0A210QSM4_MIZYE|nr:hypothetical protein KP79_PYT08240 [Mizuhopecten yessoensis]